MFYSWQSDTPPKVGRTFIRDALEATIAGLQLEDAERPEIDRDTKGVIQRNSRHEKTGSRPTAAESNSPSSVRMVGHSSYVLPMN